MMLFSAWYAHSFGIIEILALGISTMASGQALQMPLVSRAPSFSAEWQVIGPFQIGTREAVWGVDPLEKFGGISNISHDTSFIRSSLTPNATVAWTSCHALSITSEEPYESTIQLHVDFPMINWEPAQKPYGWPSIQYTAWARGKLHVPQAGPSKVALRIQGALEFVVDGKRHFGGDLFFLRRAPAILTLSPGDHVIEVRLVRDVRAFGGNDHAMDMILEAGIMKDTVNLIADSILVSDVVNGKLASPHATIALVNNGDDPFMITDLIVDKTSMRDHVQVLSEDGIIVHPGQTRSFPFVITGYLHQTHELELVFQVETIPEHGVGFTSKCNVSIPLRHKSMMETHKVTHRHPSGIVSYAMVRPPSAKAADAAKRNSAPVLLVLHGAGVEASDDVAAAAMDDLPDLPAFVVIPSGVTRWSSDDWHTFGFADVQAAIANLPAWRENVNYTRLDVNTDEWLVAGHSNGGQGTWYALTHFPDKIFGATPVSGYTSIHNYVPYTNWQPMDPHKRAIIEAAANSYRHELLVSNLAGIEIQQQHGDADDNVPPSHSRLMNSLIAQNGEYRPELVELSGNQSGHWFEGVMTTPSLATFLERKLQEYQNKSIEHASICKGSDFSYTMTVGNPGEMGPKGGIQVLQLKHAGRLGKVSVSFNHEDELWTLHTSNIAALRILSSRATRLPSWLNVPRSEFAVDDYHFVIGPSLESGNVDLVLTAGAWEVGSLSPKSRQPHQFGGLQAILHTKAPFEIIHSPSEVEEAIAVQVSRNLQTYYQADANMIAYPHEHKHVKGSNRIIISRDPGMIMGFDPLVNYPISFKIDASGRPVLQIIDPFEKDPIRLYAGSTRNKLGAVFIRPTLPSEDGKSDLDLVIWGSDADMLQWASRFAPTVTGVGQADFIIFTEKIKWAGAGSAIMGFFDQDWQITRSSAVDVDPAAGFQLI